MGTAPDILFMFMFMFMFMFIITLIFSSTNDHNVSINTHRSPFSLDAPELQAEPILQEFETAK
jgi:hypothetical protein